MLDGQCGHRLRLVSAVKGYPCTIVMPRAMSEERKKIMRAYGASSSSPRAVRADVDPPFRKLGEIRATNPSRLLVTGAVRQSR